MNILHICTEDSGGAGLCCLRIHNSLLQLGVNSKVLVLSKHNPIKGVYEFGHKRYMAWKAFNKIIRGLHLELTDFNRVYNLSAKTGCCYTIPRSVIDVSEHPLVEQADIIHLHWVDNFIDYPSFFSKSKKTIVWTLHDESLFYGIAHYSNELIKDSLLEKKYYDLKYCAINNIWELGIVFLSEMMYNKFSNQEIIKNRRKTVINNSVDPQLFHPVDKFEARRAFGLNANTVVFAFVAVNLLDPRKGLCILSQALQELKIPNAVILAVGNISKGQRLPANIFPVGSISDSEKMSAAYSCADYFVMPSKQEAFAQTPLEAMACGVPAIVFPVSGTKELINESNGIIADGFDVQNLKEGINKAINQTYDSKSIRKDIIDRFSPRNIAERYIEFYRTIL